MQKAKSVFGLRRETAPASKINPQPLPQLTDAYSLLRFDSDPGISL